MTSTPSARAPTRAREPSASPGENEACRASGLFAVVAGGETPHHVGRGVSEEVLHIQLAGTVLDRRCLPPWGAALVAGVGICTSSATFGRFGPFANGHFGGGLSLPAGPIVVPSLL